MHWDEVHEHVSSSGRWRIAIWSPAPAGSNLCLAARTRRDEVKWNWFLADHKPGSPIAMVISKGGEPTLKEAKEAALAALEEVDDHGQPPPKQAGIVEY